MIRRSALLLMVALCSGGALAQSEPVARMGAVSISGAELKTLLDQQPADVRQALAASPDALDRLVRTELVRKAVLAEALGKGWDRRPDVTARVARARDEVVVATYVNSLARPPADYPTDADVRAFYDANKASLVLPKRYRVAQIYVKRPADAASVPAAERKAADLAQKAKGAGADFAALAKASSEHESAAAGGDVGWLLEATAIPEIRPVLPKLAKGAVSDPVASPEGWHVLKVIDIAEEGPAPLDAVKPRIVETLRLQKAQELERQYLDAMIAKTPISVDRAQLDKVKP